MSLERSHQEVTKDSGEGSRVSLALARLQNFQGEFNAQLTNYRKIDNQEVDRTKAALENALEITINAIYLPSRDRDSAIFGLDIPGTSKPIPHLKFDGTINTPTGEMYTTTTLPLEEQHPTSTLTLIQLATFHNPVSTLEELNIKPDNNKPRYVYYYIDGNGAPIAVTEVHIRETELVLVETLNNPPQTFKPSWHPKSRKKGFYDNSNPKTAKLGLQFLAFNNTHRITHIETDTEIVTVEKLVISSLKKS